MCGHVGARGCEGRGCEGRGCEGRGSDATRISEERRHSGIRSSQAKPSQAKPSQAKPSQAQSSPAKPSPVQSSAVASRHVTPRHETSSTHMPSPSSFVTRASLRHALSAFCSRTSASMSSSGLNHTTSPHEIIASTSTAGQPTLVPALCNVEMHAQLGTGPILTARRGRQSEKRAARGRRDPVQLARGVNCSRRRWLAHKRLAATCGKALPSVRNLTWVHGRMHLGASMHLLDRRSQARVR